MNILRFLRKTFHRLLRRPLLRLGITLLLNFCIVAIVIAWVFMQYKRIDVELRAMNAAAFLTADYNGLYLSLLPPQDNIRGASIFELRDYPTKWESRTTIERNLARNRQQIAVPGISVWWSTRSRQSYDRVVFRFRYPFLLCVLLVLRFWLHKTFANQTETDSSTNAEKAEKDS